MLTVDNTLGGSEIKGGACVSAVYSLRKLLSQAFINTFVSASYDHSAPFRAKHPPMDEPLYLRLPVQ